MTETKVPHLSATQFLWEKWVNPRPVICILQTSPVASPATCWWSLPGALADAHRWVGIFDAIAGPKSDPRPSLPLPRVGTVCLTLSRTRAAAVCPRSTLSASSQDHILAVPFREAMDVD